MYVCLDDAYDDKKKTVPINHKKIGRGTMITRDFFSSNPRLSFCLTFQDTKFNVFLPFFTYHPFTFPFLRHPSSSHHLSLPF